MLLQKWHPYSELQRVDTLFDRLWRGANQAPATRGSYHWSIPVDVVEEPDKIVVSASLPGFSKDDIEVSVDADVLKISAKSSSETEEKHEDDGGGYLIRERRYGAFYRAMRLPKTVDQEKIESRYVDGILSIELPKTEVLKPKAIEVKAA